MEGNQFFNLKREMFKSISVFFTDNTSWHVFLIMKTGIATDPQELVAWQYCFLLFAG